MAAAAQAELDPRRYFESVADERQPIAEQEPVCLYPRDHQPLQFVVRDLPAHL